MSTSFPERKLLFIQRLTQLEDEELFAVIEQLLLNAEEGDWADTLSNQERADIQEGLLDLNAGRTETYDAFMQRIKVRLP